MQNSVWEYCSLNPDLAVDVEEFQIKLNNRWSNKANQDKNSLELASTSSSTLHDKRHSMAHMQELLEACDHSCRDSLESLDQLLTTIHGIKTSYYDVTSRTNSLMSKCESLLEEQHTLQHTVEVLTKTLKPFKDIEDIAQILGIPYESIHNNHNNGQNSPPPSHPTSSTPSSSSTSSSTLTQHLDPRSPEFKELLIKLSSAVIFLQNHPDIMENQKYTMWLEKLQVRAISLIGRAMRELIDKTAKQCRDIIQQRLFSSSHHPAITNGSGGGGGGSGGVTSRLFNEDQPVESLPIYQKFRGLSFRMKELVGVLLRGYLASVTVNDDGSATINNSSDAPPSIPDQSPRLRTPSNAVASLGVSSSSALGKYFLHLARHDYAILAEVKKSYALIRMELLQPFLNEAFLHSLANATSSSSTSIVPVSANSSGTNFSSLIEEKRFSDVRAGSGKHGNAEGGSQQHYLSLSTVIRQSFSTLLRIVQLEFQLFDSLFNIDHVHHVTPVSTLTRSMSLESSSDMIGISISNAPTPRTTNKGVTSSTAVTKTKKGGAGSGSSHQDDPASVFASDLSRVIEYISNVTRDFLRPLIIRESSVDELCRVISILSEDIKSQIAILQIPSILVKQLTTGLENVMNDSKERVIYCAETKLRQQIQFYEPLPSHLSYPEILETYEKRGEKRTDSVTTTTSFPSTTLSIEDVYDTWYPPMRLTLSLLSKLYGIIDNLIFEDFARRSIEIVITILHQGSETIKRQQKTLMMHGDLFLVRHLLILREQLIPFEVKLQSSEKFLDFTNTRLAIQQIITTTSSSSATQSTTTTATGGGNNSNSNALTSVGGATSSFLRFDENNLLLQFAKSGIPMMKETHQDMKKELDNSLKKACVSLKITACKFLLGPLDGLLAKVVAFIGDIPYQTTTANTATPSEGNGGSNKQRGGSLLSQEHTNLLKNQSFLRFERMKECFDQVQHLLLQRIPDLKAMMKVRRVCCHCY